MPDANRQRQREWAKKRVLLAFGPNRTMNLRQISAAAGFSIQASRQLVLALVSERRLKSVATDLVEYRHLGGKRKEIQVYAVPAEVDPLAMPVWLRNPVARTR